MNFNDEIEQIDPALEYEKEEVQDGGKSTSNLFPRRTDTRNE